MKNLTPMQAAYWTGREATGFLGNVSAHLYVEFDGDRIDPLRLEKAVRLLYETHEMMRLRITDEGRQHVGKAEESLSFEVEDLTGFKTADVAGRLEEKRREWTCRKLDLAAGATSAFGLSLLPGGLSRLHVDTDMVAIDPPSFCLLMEDLARFYEAPLTHAGSENSGFFDWLDQKQSDQDLAARHAGDKRWWQERLADIPPAPTLPLLAGPQPVKSSRLAAKLSPEERQSLFRSARDLRITPSALMLGLFAAVIGRATGDDRFRLNVPMFWRAPYAADVGRIVGDFSNILILGVEREAGEPLGSLCQRLAGQLVDLLAHASYPGVSVMRDLSRVRRSLQAAPVVFTSGLDLPGGDLFSERVTRLFGHMNWAVSQGPQVALDAQVAGLDGGILINWDIRYDALPEAWIGAVFEDYVRLARTIAADPEALNTPPAAIGNRSRSHTEDMLHELLRRLTFGFDVVGHRETGPEPIRELGLSGHDLREFVAFLNHFIPACALTLDDIGPSSTAATLAKLIEARSGGTSETVSRTFLETIKPRIRVSPGTEAAE